MTTTAHRVELEKVELEKVHLEFAEISRRLRELQLPNVDAVIGIGRGGVVPASMVAHQLGVPLHVLRVNYRDDDNKPRSSAPRLLEEFHFDFAGFHVLVVDDVSVTGATLNAAREVLIGASITTLVCKGKADFVLFPEVASCVIWPWSTP
jgi:uncharacterized protein